MSTPLTQSPSTGFATLISPHTPVPTSQPATAHVAEPPPKIMITLLSRKLVVHVLVTCVFLAAFTATAYHGVSVQHFSRALGDTAKADAIGERVELYNSFSGFLVALVEVLLGVSMNHFLPAFQSLRSLQASQSSVGFQSVIGRDDLGLDTSAIELLKLNFTNDAKARAQDGQRAVSLQSLGVLQGAVNGTSKRFSIRAGYCLPTPSSLGIGLDDLNSVNVVYGFPPHEWYSEMLDVELNATVQQVHTLKAAAADTTVDASAFDLNLAAELFAQGKVLLDRTIAESVSDYTECGIVNRKTLRELYEVHQEIASLSDGDDDEGERKANLRDVVRCSGPYASLSQVGTFLAATDKSPQTLLELVSQSLALSVEGLNTSSTRIELLRYNLTPQVEMESVVVTADVRIASRKPFFTRIGTDRVYDYGTYAREFCGEDDCVFIDRSNALQLPNQIVLVPQQTDCDYSDVGIAYRRDLRTFMPSNCSAVQNSAIAIALSTYIEADQYGGNITAVFPNQTSGAPFLVNPRRVLQMTMSKFAWTTEHLDKAFGVQCARTNGSNCRGLSYRLTKTGRYVFASEDAMPTSAIQAASLTTPIRLVQLNKRRFYLFSETAKDDWDEQLTAEPLGDPTAPGGRGDDWPRDLKAGRCSQLIESYLRHIQRNHFYMDSPFDTVTRATMFYLFGGGAVTELNETSIAVNASMAVHSRAVAQRTLANVKLKGDVQYRIIRVVVPRIGCGIFVLVALVVVLVPTRAMEYFAPETSTGEQFVAIKSDETYPDAVHTKTLLFPATGTTLFVADVEVEALTLVHQTDHADVVRF